eukprot:5358606-Pleurochrysis_carterae.AAC.1
MNAVRYGGLQARWACADEEPRMTAECLQSCPKRNSLSMKESCCVALETGIWVHLTACICSDDRPLPQNN